MGTNFYYYDKPPCECCKRAYEPVYHLGKSSGGWRFSLRVTDQWKNWDDFVAFLSSAPGCILNEYGDRVSASDLIYLVESKSDGRSHVDYDTRNTRESGPADLCDYEFS